MKKCAACQKEIADEAKFCNFCGAKVEVAEARKCPKCGEPVGPGTKYCPKCGYELSDKLKNILNFDLENVDPDSKLGRKLAKIDEIDWSSGLAGFILKFVGGLFALILCALVFWAVWKLARWVMTATGMM